MESLTDKTGVTAYNLIKCANKYNLNAIGYKYSFNELKNIKLPCILHLKINQSLHHFVVLYKIKKDDYTIMDPAKGLVKVPKSILIKQYTNNLIIFNPSTVIPKKKNENIAKKTIIKELLLKRNIIVKIVILNFISIILSIILSYYIKLYDYKNYIVILSIIFLSINILLNCLNIIIENIMNKTNHFITKNLIKEFFKYILSLPLKYLHIKDPAEIVKRCEEVYFLNESIINLILIYTINLFAIIIVGIILWFYNAYVTLSLMLFLVCYFFISIKIRKNTNLKIKEYIEESTNYNNYMINYIYGLTSINHAKCSSFIINKITSFLSLKQLKEYSYKKHLVVHENINKLFLTSYKLFINFYIVVHSFNSDIKKIIIINILLDIIINSYINILNTIPTISYLKTIILKINSFYNFPFKNNNSNIMFENGNILIKNLCYKYNDNYKLFKNFNLEIKKREKVIIKGSSGCGKTTLCKLLNKEYTEYNGEILINNINIKKIDDLSYKDNISYSSQNEKLFNGTIKDNILMGKKYSDEELMKIINICGLNELIKKKVFGLDTFLIGGGEELSGGEKQLIILARALISNFEILILDETLSEVNKSLEEKIINNLFNYYQDKTIIYVSHKNSNYNLARIIYV